MENTEKSSSDLKGNTSHSPEIRAKINDIFNENLDQYQTTINQLIYISFLACGIWAIALSWLSNYFGILSLPWSRIAIFSAVTVLDLTVVAIVLWAYGRKSNQKGYINVYKYTLLTCVSLNYLGLILFIPFKEMWLAAFFFIFLSTLFFDVKAVLYVSTLIFIASAISYWYQPIFRTDNGQELFIRVMWFAFAVFAAVVASVVSRRLFWQTAEKEYELSVSMHNMEQRRQVAEGLRDILAVLNSDQSLEDVLKFIVSEARRIVDTDACALYKMDTAHDLLSVEMTSGLPDEFNNQKDYPMDFGALGEAAKERKPVHVTDFTAMLKRYHIKPSFQSRAKWAEENLTSMLVVPLVCKNEVYGGICFFFKGNDCETYERCCFTDEKIKLASAFADQAALAIDNARLREETQEVAVAQERNRLARDLHDAVTQTLFSTSLIADALPTIWDKDPIEGRKRLIEIKELSKGALAEMRALLLELRPTTLVETNLFDLLNHLKDATIGRARIPIKLENNLTFELPVDVKIGFYRIAQEAVNNIAKHAAATEGSIVLRETIGPFGEKLAEMIIKDNGKGFDESLVESDHIGLDIMRERAEAISGRIIIESAKGSGTLVTVLWEVH